MKHSHVSPCPQDEQLAGVLVIAHVVIFLANTLGAEQLRNLLPVLNQENPGVHFSKCSEQLVWATLSFCCREDSFHLCCLAPNRSSIWNL
jgi:hypothetical protein